MEISSAVEAIIWDLDGTLLDSFDIFQKALSDVASSFDIPMPDRSTLAANYHGSLEITIQAVLQIPDEQLLEEVIAAFLEEQGDYYDVPNECLYKDALQLTERIAALGLPQFLITNRTHNGRGSASPRNIIENSVLQTVISEIICRDDTEVHKPDPAVAWPLLEKYSLDPRSILVIGDQHVDAELARNLGCQAVIVGRNGQSPHLETIPHWQSFATSVTSLDEVAFS